MNVTQTPNAKESQGLLLVVDGVGGFHLCGTALRRVVRQAGLPIEVKIVPWGHGLGRWHSDLTDVKNHIAQAALIVKQVLAYRVEKPGAAVFLLGKSGGAGLVVRALELLPEVSVDAVTLLAPALSPGYDLSKALQAVRQEMVVFYSPLDLLILGAGTRIFGTVDGIKSVSAGLVGFRVPDQIDSSSQQHYQRLRQVRWNPEMALCGYFGGHFGPDLPQFLRKYVVPVLASHLPQEAV